MLICRHGQGFPAGKLEHGELLAGAAKRELLEETRLTGKPELAAITHYLDLDSNGNCITDKIMFLFIVRNPTGKLAGSAEGEYVGVKSSEVEEKITKPFEKMEGVLKELDMIEAFDGNINFIEKENNVEENF